MIRQISFIQKLEVRSIYSVYNNNTGKWSIYETPNVSKEYYDVDLCPPRSWVWVQIEEWGNKVEWSLVVVVTGDLLKERIV